MPAENVDLVRRAIEAFNSGDVERIIALADTDFEAAIPPELSAEPDTYRGHDGLRRYFGSFYEVMDEIRFHPSRFWQAGDRVAVTLRMTARGRHTEIPVEQHLVQVWSLRDGRIARVHTYASLEQALEAIGRSTGTTARRSRCARW